MKNSKYILALITLLLFAGCESILNTRPQQSIDANQALNTSSDVKRVLKGAYNDLGDFDVYGGEFYVLPDVMGADGEIKYTGTQPPVGDIHRKNISTTNAFIRDEWLNSYKAINDANAVLSALNVVDKSDRKKVEGQAKFIRAIIYFQLVRLYGKDYNDGNPSKNMGVPLKLNATKTIGKNQKIPRNSIQAVYNQVIKDLKDAESDLKEHPPGYIYVDKYAASAFLARVYLQEGAYKKARDEANKVIQNGPYSLVKNYADEFNNSSINTSEDIFAMQVSKQDGTNALQGTYASLNQGGSNSYMVVVTTKHLNLYKSVDDRRKLFYKAENGNYHTGKWKNQYGNVNVIRLAEMYLDRAECNKRLGTNEGATPTQDINTLRNRAGLKDLKSPVTLKEILHERHIELAFEGYFLFDLKRLKKSVGGTPWNSPRLVFPIPQREIDANPKLKQNPGYGG